MTRRGFRSNDRHRLRLLVALGLCVAAATLSSSVAQAVSAATPPADTTACPTYNAPNTLTLAGGTPQSAKLGTPFADPLQVTLANTNGCPITTPLAGIAVTFAAPGSGPSGTFSASGSNAVLVGTNAAGSATASQFTANTLAGGYQVVASSDYGSVSFSLVNTASGVPATIAPLSAASQSATVSTRYAQPLQAQVLDANGNPVTGANVTFSLGSGSGGGAGGSGSERAARARASTAARARQARSPTAPGSPPRRCSPPTALPGSSRPPPRPRGSAKRRASSSTIWPASHPCSIPSGSASFPRPSAPGTAARSRRS